MMGKCTINIKLWCVSIDPVPALQCRSKSVNASKLLLICWVDVFKTNLQSADIHKINTDMRTCNKNVHLYSETAFPLTCKVGELIWSGILLMAGDK